MATAQEGTTVEETRAASFRAVRGAPEDQVSGGTLLIAAYAFIFVAMLFYIFVIHRSALRTRADLQELRHTFGQSSPPISDKSDDRQHKVEDARSAQR